MTFEELARDLYEFYMKESGGVSATGTVLPSWEEFCASERHAKQYRAWLMTASHATTVLLGPEIFTRLSVEQPKPNNDT